MTNDLACCRFEVSEEPMLIGPLNWIGMTTKRLRNISWLTDLLSLLSSSTVSQLH